MKGRIIDVVRGMNGKWRVTVEVDIDFLSHYEKLKDKLLNVDFRRYVEKRSKDANAYFHVLVGKIAEAQCVGVEEVKTLLVLEYGAMATDADGHPVVFRLPQSVDAATFYEYTKVFDVKEHEGRLYNYYLAYKRTRDHDSTEMHRLIDGAIFMAKGLGISTDTPEQLAKYKEYWKTV